METVVGTNLIIQVIASIPVSVMIGSLLMALTVVTGFAGRFAQLVEERGHRPLRDDLTERTS